MVLVSAPAAWPVPDPAQLIVMELAWLIPNAAIEVECLQEVVLLGKVHKFRPKTRPNKTNHVLARFFAMIHYGLQTCSAFSIPREYLKLNVFSHNFADLESVVSLWLPSVVEWSRKIALMFVTQGFLSPLQTWPSADSLCKNATWVIETCKILWILFTFEFWSFKLRHLCIEAGFWNVQLACPCYQWSQWWKMHWCFQSYSCMYSNLYHW